MYENTIHTPWGWTDHIEELAEGIWRVFTPSHGGLKLSEERWAELPPEVRDTLMNARFAEEDCEEPIVRVLLGLAEEWEREHAITIARYFHRYAPALPHLQESSKGVNTTKI